jgi:hypothetical protein
LEKKEQIKAQEALKENEIQEKQHDSKMKSLIQQQLALQNKKKHILSEQEAE